MRQDKIERGIVNRNNAPPRVAGYIGGDVRKGPVQPMADPRPVKMEKRNRK